MQQFCLVKREKNGNSTGRDAASTKFEIDSGLLLSIVLILLLSFCLLSNCLEHSQQKTTKIIEEQMGAFLYQTPK